MELLIIFLIGVYMLFLIPAFMFTWEGSVFDGIGCYGWICMLVGLPGALLALVIKGLIKLSKIPGEKKAEEERKILEQQRLEEEHKREEQEKAKRKAYQEALLKKKNVIFPNSPVTKEIVSIITRTSEMPYMIEIDGNGIIFHFENSTKNYIFRTHGLPNFDLNEETIFAEVLNQKLNNRYSISEIKKYHSFTHHDGTLDGYETHIATKLELKTTRSF